MITSGSRISTQLTAHWAIIRHVALRLTMRSASAALIAGLAAVSFFFSAVHPGHQLRIVLVPRGDVAVIHQEQHQAIKMPGKKLPALRFEIAHAALNVRVQC